MLGFVMTSVFFFFIMRQRANIAVQRDTVSILNKKAYLESFADYVENLSAANLAKITLPFDGITGTVTNNPKELTGSVEMEEKKEYKFSGEIYIEWNKCTANMKADLDLDGTLYQAKNGGCNGTYDDAIGPIAVKDSFTLKALNAPFYYRITAKDDKTTLIDGKWHMDLSIDLGNGKKENIKKSFKPKS